MYTSKATLAKWGKVKRVNRAAGGQSQITGYVSKLNRQGTKRPGSAGVSGDEQPGSDSAGSATTAAQPAAATADQPARRQREISLARHECSQAPPRGPAEARQATALSAKHRARYCHHRLLSTPTTPFLALRPPPAPSRGSTANTATTPPRGVTATPSSRSVPASTRRPASRIKQRPRRAH